MANPLGDFDASAVIYGKFTTVTATTGAPGTLGGTPALSVYKDNSTTQSTTGVTLTVDFDTVPGLNHYTIDTSADGTFYAAGSFFDIVVTTGTVGGVSAVGYCVGSFTIRKNSALKPTTAGRALDVSAGGEAGVDWANVGSPTTANALTATSIITTQKVDVDTIKTNPVVNAGTITFPTTATLASTTNITAGTVTTATNVTTVNGLAAGVITAASIAADAITDAKVASDVTIASVTGAVGSVTGNVGGNVVGSVGSVTAAVTITAASVQAIWDALTSALTTVGSIGKLLVDNVNASISAIKTQTDKLTFTVANQIDANVLDWKSATAPAMTGDAFARLGAPAGASVSADIAALNVIDTAIKAKTDNLPASPAAVGSAMTLTAGERNSCADALLARNIAGGSSTGRIVTDALRLLRNKWSVAAGTLTVTQEDDTTAAWTAAVSSDAAAVPITGSDPA